MHAALLEVQRVLVVDGDNSLLLVGVSAFIDGLQVSLGATERSHRDLDASGVDYVFVALLCEYAFLDNDELRLEVSDEFGLEHDLGACMWIAPVGLSLHEADEEAGAIAFAILLLDLEARHDRIFASFKIDLDEAEHRAAEGHVAPPAECEQVQMLAVLEPLVLSLDLLQLERVVEHLL